MLNLFAAEEANQIFLPGDINEFYWGSAAFLVVVIFLWWKVRPPVAKMIKTAREKTQDQLNQSKWQIEEAEEELKKLRSELGDMSAERERILAEARVTAEELEASIKARAEQDAAEMRRRATLDAELSLMQAESDIKQLVASRAVLAAEAVVEGSLTPEIQTQLVDSYIKDSLDENKMGKTK